MQHWSITREADGLATLTFDRADAGTNTLSAAALTALNGALDILDREPPKGLVVRSGKANASSPAPTSTNSARSRRRKGVNRYTST